MYTERGLNWEDYEVVRVSPSDTPDALYFQLRTKTYVRTEKEAFRYHGDRHDHAACTIPMLIDMGDVEYAKKMILVAKEELNDLTQELTETAISGDIEATRELSEYVAEFSSAYEWDKEILEDAV